MSFLNRLAVLEPVETWPGIETAAEERFLDGFALATGGVVRPTAAVYLLGYSVELRLKAAFFRFTGVAPHEDLWAVGGPMAYARNHAGWHGRNLHDLLGWLGLLTDERAALGQPLPVETATLLQLSVLTVDAHWRETLRYKHTAAAPGEVEEAYQGADWLRANYERLWS